METINLHLLSHRIKIIFLIAAGMTAVSCTKDDESPICETCSDDINSYVEALIYNPNDLLNVRETEGLPSKRTVKDTAQGDETTEGGVTTTCTKTSYNLEQNFDEVAILRPTNGIVWPGALVIGNQSLMDGLPEPLPLPRGEVQLRVDLPGIGENGNIIVTDPNNGNVQAKIDEALDWWNNNQYQEGYVNASNSSVKKATSYSSKQLSLDVGLNVEWASGNVASEFSYNSSSEKFVAMMVYKQAFYSVTMETPSTPASVFGPNTTVETVQKMIDGGTPPAYVSSVVYGRIIMFRLETTLNSTSVELEAALSYASGVKVDATIEAKVKEILAKSTMTVVTIGGNAEIASEAVSAKDFGDLETIIKGKNAVYSKSNPGVAIAYTVRFLKDNSLAKMGYTTDYTATTCEESLTPAASFKLENGGWYNVRFKFSYTDNSGAPQSGSSGTLLLDQNKKVNFPAGSHNIKVTVEYNNGSSWKHWRDYSVNAGQNRCLKTSGTLFGRKIGNC